MTQMLKENPLAVLIDLEKRVRSALTIEELGFIIVNETFKIVQYHQAILFDASGNILVFSGTATFEKNSPFIYWLNKHLSPLSRDLKTVTEISKKDFEVAAGSGWDDWFPKHGILIPLVSPLKGKMGCLFLVRNKNWNSNEREILDLVNGIYGHSWGVFKRVKIIKQAKNSKIFTKVMIVVGLLCLLMFPVPLTVLAPSEIVAINPSVIRAPIKGVVEKISVSPNQVVGKGDVLFFMDSLSQRNDLDIAQKVLKSLKIQYAQLTRQALSDISSKKFLVKTLGQLKEQEIRIKNLKLLIARMKVVAPHDGTVIIDSPNAWEGRPVNLGEKIISLADQNSVEVESWLSVADVIKIETGAPIRLYLNSDPLNPISARMHSFSYEAQERPGFTFAHRIRAKIFDIELMPRLGLRGTARISGKKVTIFYWIFRRPISALRQFFGI